MYLVVQAPCYRVQLLQPMIVFQGLVWVFKNYLKAVLVKLEGQLFQSSETEAPLPSADAF